jgi:Pyridoxamine 5'-phosphate oxidase
VANFFETLNPTLADFIRRQPLFFVATAAAEGRINLSPKGLDSLRVLNDRTVAYLDITGSGAETAAHVRHDGRLTFMFCSFDEKPLILRLYGRGEVVRPNDPKWNDLFANFTPTIGQWQIVVLHIESLQTSCGFGVPRMQLIEHRTDLTDWATKKGEQGLIEYRAKKNSKSIDGLPTGMGTSGNS